MTNIIEISVVVPIFNEQDSLKILNNRLLSVLENIGTFEVIYVNDGSSDNTENILNSIHESSPYNIKVIHLRLNCGKAIALQTGFDAAKGKLVAMIDADLQDQPEELPKMIAFLQNSNLDAVTGWKVNRKDSIGKTLPSRFFNFVMSKMSGLNIHDFNCGLKIFRCRCLSGFRLYGQMHRFILFFISSHGYKVGEIPIEHAAREFGVSKFGSKRFFHGLMDILTVFFITRYLWSPLHFFGLYGSVTIAFSIISGLFYIMGHFYSVYWNNPAWHLANHPLWVLSPVLFLIGLMMIFFGLIGELLAHHSVNTSKSNFIAYKKGLDNE